MILEITNMIAPFTSIVQLSKIHYPIQNNTKPYYTQLSKQPKINIMKLDTIAQGFFTSDNKTYINLEVSKSSPNRKGQVISIESANMAAYPSLKRVEVRFRDFTENIAAYDLEEVNESIHCYYSPIN